MCHKLGNLERDCRSSRRLGNKSLISKEQNKTIEQLEKDFTWNGQIRVK